MPKTLFIAATCAKPGRQDEPLACYRDEHLPDMRAVPGMGDIHLHRISPIKLPEHIAPPDAFIIHEIDGDVAEMFRKVADRSRNGAARHTEVLYGARSIVFTTTRDKARTAVDA